MLTVALCAVLADASSFGEISDWLHDLDEHARTRLGVDRRLPADTTVWRLPTRLDAGLLTPGPGRLAAHPHPTDTAPSAPVPHRRAAHQHRRRPAQVPI